MRLETSFLRRGVATAGLLAGLMLGGGIALAQGSGNTAPPPPPPAADAPGMPGGQDAGRGHFSERCKADPQKCAEMKQHMTERNDERKAACAKGADACKAWHEQERAKREEWCKANAQKCAEMKQDMKQRMEEHRAACKADPDAPHCRHRMPPADGKPMEPPLPPGASAQ